MILNTAVPKAGEKTYTKWKLYDLLLTNDSDTYKTVNGATFTVIVPKNSANVEETISGILQFRTNGGEIVADSDDGSTYKVFGSVMKPPIFEFSTGDSGPDAKTAAWLRANATGIE